MALFWGPSHPLGVPLGASEILGTLTSIGGSWDVPEPPKEVPGLLFNFELLHLHSQLSFKEVLPESRQVLDISLNFSEFFDVKLKLDYIQLLKCFKRKKSCYTENYQNMFVWMWFILIVFLFLVTKFFLAFLNRLKH